MLCCRQQRLTCRTLACADPPTPRPRLPASPRQVLFKLRAHGSFVDFCETWLRQAWQQVSHEFKLLLRRGSSSLPTAAAFLEAAFGVLLPPFENSGVPSSAANRATACGFLE